MKKSFHSNGKLLLTGEYAVLDGALALSIPTRFGQKLEVSTSEEEGLLWRSFNNDETLWFEGHFSINNKGVKRGNDDKTGQKLQEILREAKKLSSSFLEGSRGYKVKTTLDFPRDWGLGSSSTLIHNIAMWADVDPFELLQESFGGSGYDIAQAGINRPILYCNKNGKPQYEPVHLDWNFKSELFFVHLNEKQDSREGILRYKNATPSEKEINRISEISKAVASCRSLQEFSALLFEHEEIISKLIGLPTVGELRFKDYPKLVKSLGAWGGDFVLAVGNEADKNYFRKNGYRTIIPFHEMIK